MLRLVTRRASQRFVVRHSSKTVMASTPRRDALRRHRRIAFIRRTSPSSRTTTVGAEATRNTPPNYDRIFGNKNGSTKKAAPEQTAPQPAAQALDARDALALRRILRESGESSTLKEILEESGWRRSRPVPNVA